MNTKGYKSTEFWLSLVAMLVGFLMSSGALGGDEDTGMKIAGLVSTILAALGYTAGRTLVKKTKMQADSLALPDGDTAKK